VALTIINNRKAVFTGDNKVAAKCYENVLEE